MLDSAALGLKALFKCLVYVAWMFFFIRTVILIPWMELRSRRVPKKHRKMWLAMVIVMVVAWLFYFVLWMDRKATSSYSPRNRFVPIDPIYDFG